MKKPASATEQGASSLLYRRTRSALSLQKGALRGPPRRRGCAGDRGAGQGEGLPLKGLTCTDLLISSNLQPGDFQSAGEPEALKSGHMLPRVCAT